MNAQTLNYSPSLIPLISKASYKIISTHISSLVELFVDDLLEEQIYVLEEIELNERMNKEKNRSRETLNDYKR